MNFRDGIRTNDLQLPKLPLNALYISNDQLVLSYKLPSVTKCGQSGLPSVSPLRYLAGLGCKVFVLLLTGLRYYEVSYAVYFSPNITV